MDNVIQNINLEDIVLNNHQQYNAREIGELAASIKQLGLLEPITVRPKNNKYELVLGNKRYLAAKQIGLKTIPAIIKLLDDYKLKDYSMVNKTNQFLSTSITDNTDVINLSKLNKEYERDELIMNNNQFDNNNIMQTSNTNEQPTFGGRFFPSLEDEPTNMNFSAPTPEPQSNSNFIDLTDLNIGNQPSPTPQNNFVDPQMSNNIQQPNFSVGQDNGISNINPNFDIPQNPPTSIDANNNIINLESLKQNPEMGTQPINPEINIDNNFQDVINDFHPNAANSMSNQFDQIPVSELNSMNPTMSPTSNINSFINQPYNMPQEMTAPINEQPTLNNPEFIQTNINNQMNSPIMPNQYMEPVMPQTGINPMVSMPSSIQSEIPQQIAAKDTLPVINTLKALAVNLENFGYTIRITDEDLPTSYKITIEVDK